MYSSELIGDEIATIMQLKWWLFSPIWLPNVLEKQKSGQVKLVPETEWLNVDLGNIMSFSKKIKTVVRCVIFVKEKGRMRTSHELIWENKTQAKKGSVI